MTTLTSSTRSVPDKEIPMTQTIERRPTAEATESLGRHQETELDPRTLTPEQLAEIEKKFDAIRDEIMSQRGESDAKYIRRVLALQRQAELPHHQVAVLHQHCQQHRLYLLALVVGLHLLRGAHARPLHAYGCLHAVAPPQLLGV